jgi:hypothetical protein
MLGRNQGLVALGAILKNFRLVQHSIDALASLAAKTLEAQSRLQNVAFTRDWEMAEIAGAGCVAHDDHSQS